MRFDIEVAIAGGGPAGAACALVLARLGRQVALFERSVEPRARPGETLPPDARIVLEELGLWQRFEKDGPLPSYSIEAYWGSAIAASTDFIASPYGCGFHVDRARFESMLLDAAVASGAQVHCGVRVLGAREESSGASIRFDDGRTLSARFVVDAGGRASSLLGRRRRHDRMVGVSLCLAATADPLLLVEAVEDGWWYSAPLPQGALIAVLMTDADLLPPALSRGDWLAARLACAPATGARTRGARPMAPLRITSAASSRLERPVGISTAAAGDAAAAYDPLAGTGILSALRDGGALAHAIDEALGSGGALLAAYGARIEQRFDTYLRQRRFYYARERRFATSPFWNRRADPRFDSADTGLQGPR